MAWTGANLALPSATRGSAQGCCLRQIGTSLMLALMLVGAAAASPLAAAPLEPEAARAAVEGIATRAVKALKARNLGELSTLVHPEKGVRFAPYAFVEPKQDRRLTAAAVRKALADPALRVWGTYDGSDKAIRLSFSGYYKWFVYDVDFAAATAVYNGEQKDSGNTHNNLREEYPEATIVAFTVPAKTVNGDPDDRILRLVFENFRGSWYLVYVVHDEWTT